MVRVGHWLAPPPRDPLEERCWLHKYRGVSWRQVVETDQPYVEWLLFESDVVLDTRLRAALMDSMEELTVKEEKWPVVD